MVRKGEVMSKSNIEPHKITKPFQLLAAWLITLILLVGLLLTSAIRITTPAWITPMLTITAIIIIPGFLYLVFLMQTKYRPYLLEDKYFKDFLKKDEANEYIPTDIKDKNAIEIKYGNSYKFNKLKLEEQEINLLTFKARINYPHEAGSQYLMKLNVNGEYLKANDLINKSLTKRYADGREYSWFNEKDNSWFINYSPNFKQNYFSGKYRVINGDPYLFIFDLSRIKIENGTEYNIVIEHNGLVGNDAYRNSIIIEKPVVF